MRDKLSIGAAIGNVMAGYRDNNPKQCATAAVDIIRYIEALEARIATLERGAGMQQMLRDNGL